MNRPFRRSNPRRRRLMGLVALLAVATASATYLQAGFSVLAVYLTADLGVTRSQLGVAFAVLSVVGGLASPLAGSISDRSTRTVMIGLFAFSAVSVMVTAAAPHFLWLLVAASLAGLAFSAGNPVTNRVVSEEISLRRQGLAIGIKQTGPPMALLAAGLVIPPLAGLIGWRWAFTVTVAVPLAAIGATRALVPASGSSGVDRSPVRMARRATASSTVRWLAWSSVLTSSGIGAIIAFVPLYAHERLGLSEPAAGLVASLIGLCGVVARVAWGAGGRRFRDPAGLRLIAAAAMAGTLMIWAASAAPGLIWVAALVAGLSMPGWHVVAWLVLLDEVGSAGIGRSTGVVHLGNSLGFAAGPALVGLVVDASDSYAWGWGLVVALFAMTTGLLSVWKRRLAGSAADERE